jgi:hypothetical protein
VVSQLRSFGQPVAVAAAARDFTTFKSALSAEHGRVSLLHWPRFPFFYRGTRWGGTSVLEKLNVLRAPWPRVVWIDPDMLVTRSVAELCNASTNESFSAAVDEGRVLRTCQDSSFERRRQR